MLVEPKKEVFPLVTFPLVAFPLVTFPLVAFPLVIFPPMVAFPPVMLVSGVLMFCAFTEFRPTIAIMPIIAARIGMIKTNCFFIAFLSVLLSYKGLEVTINIEKVVRTLETSNTFSCIGKLPRLLTLLNLSYCAFELKTQNVRIGNAQLLCLEGQ